MKKGIKILVTAVVAASIAIGATCGTLHGDAEAVAKDQAITVKEARAAYAPKFDEAEKVLAEEGEEATDAEREMSDQAAKSEGKEAEPQEAEGESVDASHKANEENLEEETEGEAADGITEAEEEIQNGEASEGFGNGYSEVYELVLAHVSEIFSLAAFCGSIILAVIYKSGLMPLMRDGLSGLKNAAVKIKEATDSAELHNKESIDSIAARIDALEETFTDMGKAFDRLADALSGYRSLGEHNKRIDTILEGELDMLYDIFMTSALPEYEKARVGERMTRLREVLNSDEGEK